MKKNLITLRPILKFGSLSGAVSSVMLAVAIPFQDQIGFDRGVLVGYASIVLSFLLVYFGVRSYRDTEGGGQITFGKAFVVGLLITLISCVCYVVTWEIAYYQFMPDFLDKYSAYALAKAKAAGASPAVLAAQAEHMAHYREMYANPVTNAAITFLEPFPIGLVMTLVSAAVLRRRGQKVDISPGQPVRAVDGAAHLS